MFNIYGILCKTTWKVYYGSTELTIERRLEIHEKDYKAYLKGYYHYVSSYEVLKNNNYEIKLLEKCDNKIHMEEREGYYIRTFPCVNKCIPGRTMKEYNKQYREANKVQITEKRKEKYTCACGSSSTIHHKSDHEKTNKHKKYLASL